MEKLKFNPKNEKYYSEEFIKGFECGVERQFNADKAEPETAEWIPIIDHGKDTGYIRCSACGAGEPMARFPHCPECGTEMVNWGICKGDTE